MQESIDEWLKVVYLIFRRENFKLFCWRALQLCQFKWTFDDTNNFFKNSSLQVANVKPLFGISFDI